MLARALPGVPVLVCPDRHLAGRVAERQFGCTVMLLDDGFQHLPLGREVDLLVMPASDLDDAVLPSGRLREPLDAASSADCILVPGSDEDVERGIGCVRSHAGLSRVESVPTAHVARRIGCGR